MHRCEDDFLGERLFEGQVRGLFLLCRTQTTLWIAWWLVTASAIETTVSNGELFQGSSHINLKIVCERAVDQSAD